jgi:septum formation protein
MNDFIYLASQSPRRQQLLAQIGVPHELLLPSLDEDTEALEMVIQGELPAAYVQRVTKAKLHAAHTRLKQRGLASAPILCADTVVALRGKIYGKPANAEQAFQTLSDLSGRAHRVLTAAALCWQGSGGAELHTACVMSISRVCFAPLMACEIQAYIATGEPFGKAGAYAIQSAAAVWVERIEGSYSAIMGLPLHETYQLLKKAQVQTALTGEPMPCKKF